MSSAWERGFAAGYRAATREEGMRIGTFSEHPERHLNPAYREQPKKTRKKSAWQKYVANKRNQIKYKSGKRKGMLNLRAMGVQYRKKKRR